jgi:hypothetical protein
MRYNNFLYVLTITWSRQLIGNVRKVLNGQSHQQIILKNTICSPQAPTSMWTEDYQVVTLAEHFKAFDTLYREGFLIGEMIWNFADFATPQGEVSNIYIYIYIYTHKTLDYEDVTFLTHRFQ